MERDLKCMYCAEAGITNTDVFIEIVDVELGAGWICKECFIQSEKEKDEHLKEIEQQLKAKEQECERTKERLESFQKDYSKLYQVVENKGYIKELDQLKAEVKSKTEYIQEQRDIINQYSKEIEMYKKCQGKRASKREEELKAENKHLNDLLNQALKELEKTRETLTEIKEIAEKGHKEKGNLMRTWWFKDILQKISECEEQDGN